MIPDSLQTIAEISIGLAGFSGLIVVLRKKPGPLTDVWYPNHAAQQFVRMLFILPRNPEHG